MAQIRLHCCCGSSVDFRSWPAPEVDMEGWFKVHNLCAITWQRERGLRSTITYPDQKPEE